MPQDELATWLRASAENKITTKNTWRATLIEHFSDISQFRGQHGINFQKAGCALEGCVKVYSTRVDDVSENTNKLLGIFSREEDPKRRCGKRRTDFIEKNINNINLKETLSSSFYDPVFSSVLARTDELFLVDVLEQTEAGMFMYENRTETIVYNDIEVEMDFRALPICASLKEVRGAESMVPVHEEYRYDEEYNPGDDNHMDMCNDDLGMDGDAAASPGMDADGGACIPSPTEAAEQFVYEETPFGYFKGWAGPSHWRVATPAVRAAAKPKKPRERYFVDFLREADYSFLFDKADTTMSKEQIMERRRNRNLMPEDFSYRRADLYKYFMKDEQFAGPWGSSVAAEDSEHVGHVAEMCAADDFTAGGLGMDAAECAEDGGDASIAEADLSSRFEQSMMLEEKEALTGLKAPRAPKKVDIKRLKENVQGLLEDERLSLCDIYKGIPGLYEPKETKDISVHMCLISLLHLANENSYELEQASNDIYIRR